MAADLKIRSPRGSSQLMSARSTLYNQALWSGFMPKRLFILSKLFSKMRLFGTEMAPNEGEDEIPPITPPSPRLPDAMLRTIGGTEGGGLVLVTRKTLTRSDVAVRQSRLVITTGEVLRGQLSEQEQRELARPKGYVEVEVVDPSGERNEMKLRRWGSSNTLVLNSGWIKLVKDNKLEAGVDCIELWSFRTGLKLCFALNVERQLTMQDHP